MWCITARSRLPTLTSLSSLERFDRRCLPVTASAGALHERSTMHTTARTGKAALADDVIAAAVKQHRSRNIQQCTFDTITVDNQNYRYKQEQAVH